jgi:Uma2 family endonuclease
MTVATEPAATAADPEAVTASELQHDIPDVPIYRLSVAQYHAMGRAGILDEDAPVELLEGWLAQKMTKHRPHTLATLLLRRALERLIEAGWYVDSQEPVTTADSEPEPDIAVVRGDPRDYPDRHPGPHDVALVVEVAESSLRQDRGPKKRVYAAGGIPVYWIVNLEARQIEVYTEPHTSRKASGYRQRHDYGDAVMIPVVLDGDEVGHLNVRDLLP